MSIIKICNVKYSYDGNRKVLKNISAEFEAGKMYAILGFREEIFRKKDLPGIAKTMWHLFFKVII